MAKQKEKTTPARGSAASKNVSAEKRGAQPKAGSTGAKPAPKAERESESTRRSQSSKSTTGAKNPGEAAARSTGANAQSQRAARTKPYLKKGAALRTRDEYLKNGVEKPEHKDDKLYYRVVYTVEVNGLNEAAVVKRTTKKGRHLKEKSSEKFHEEIFIEDNEGNAIKIGDKFVRSVQDDIGKVDVDYILKRCKFYPDTAEKLNKFRTRKK